MPAYTLLLVLLLSPAVLPTNDTETQYSPHLWTKKSSDTVLKDYIAAISEASERTRETVPFVKDLRYGANPRQLLDIYGNQTLPPDAPLLVFVHGGYWQLLSKEISCQMVQPLWRRGVRVIVPSYDLAPNVSIGDIMTEVQEMAGFVMDYAVKNNVKELWIVGHSAGAHLVASLLSSDWLPPQSRSSLAGLVIISGIYDLTPLTQTSYNENLKLNSSLAKKWSPMSEKKITLSVKEGFKTLVYVGDVESPEFINQSRRYYNVLKKQGINSEFHLLHDIDHFDIASNLQYEEFIMTKELVKLFHTVPATL